MSTRKLQLATTAAALAGGLLLGGCGSGDDGGAVTTPPPTSSTNEVPSSALVSATTFTAYAASLTNSDTAAPVEINNFGAAPTVDTTEGSAI